MARAAAILATALLTGACATEDGFRKMVDPYVGQPESAVVTRLGPPDSSYQIDKNAGGAKVISYTRSASSTMPGYAQTNCYRGTCFTSVTPATAYSISCQLVFEISEGIIRSYRYQGNGCTA